MGGRTTAEHRRRYRQRNKEKLAEAQRRYRAKNIDRIRARAREYMLAYDLKRLYGMSVEEFESMLVAQGGRCAICRRAPGAGKRLTVDHDHATGAIRGLLCSNCNAMLGQAKDNPNTLLSAIDYLTQTPIGGA